VYKHKIPTKKLDPLKSFEFDETKAVEANNDKPLAEENQSKQDTEVAELDIEESKRKKHKIYKVSAKARGKGQYFSKKKRYKF